MYICPVCGFNKLDLPPTNHNICPSCGTEFDLDDVGVSVQQLRENWVNRGSVWWSLYDRSPANWNPILQLQNVGVITSSPASITCVSKIRPSGFSPILNFKGSFSTCHA